jgi:hypothetical protein
MPNFKEWFRPNPKDGNQDGNQGGNRLVRRRGSGEKTGFLPPTTKTREAANRRMVSEEPPRLPEFRTWGKNESVWTKNDTNELNTSIGEIFGNGAKELHNDGSNSLHSIEEIMSAKERKLLGKKVGDWRSGVDSTNSQVIAEEIRNADRILSIGVDELTVKIGTFSRGAQDVLAKSNSDLVDSDSRGSKGRDSVGIFYQEPDSSSETTISETTMEDNINLANTDKIFVHKDSKLNIIPIEVVETDRGKKVELPHYKINIFRRSLTFVQALAGEEDRKNTWISGLGRRGIGERVFPWRRSKKPKLMPSAG